MGNKKKSKGKSRSKSRKKNRICCRCGKIGHFVKDCYKKKNNQKENLIDEENVIEPFETNT